MSWTDAQLGEAREIALRASARIVSPTLRSEHEDVAQHTLMQLLEQDPAQLQDWRSWVAAVARNRARQIRRNHARHHRLEPTVAAQGRPTGTPSGIAVHDAVLRQLLGVLNERDARLFVAAAVDGTAHADLAAEFGLKNANVVAVTLHGIKKRLREHFGANELRQMLGPMPRPYNPHLLEPPADPDGQA